MLYLQLHISLIISTLVVPVLCRSHSTAALLRSSAHFEYTLFALTAEITFLLLRRTYDFITNLARQGNRKHSLFVER